jgi:hypothetical protein
MEWKDIFGKILDPALEVVKAFVPGSGLVIQGVKAIASVFGLREDEVTPEKLQELAAQDKDFTLKMMQANQLFQISIMKEETERLKLQLADVQSARGMNVETTKATGKRDINLYALAWVIVIGFFGLVGILIFKDLPKDSNGVVFMLFGALCSGFTGIIGYFFGSSQSSSIKTELLAKAEPIK